MKMFVNFDVKTDRTSTVWPDAQSRRPRRSLRTSETSHYRQKSQSSPLMIIALHSPKGTTTTCSGELREHHINDQLDARAGIASVTVFGAGQYAMRVWVRPDGSRP